MTERNSTQTTLETTSILERIAQSILIGYAWVAGPGMTEQQRPQQELAKGHRLDLEVDSTSIVG